MIDHVSIGVRSLEKATRFYDAVLGALGLERLVEREGSIGYGGRYPVFWLNARPDMAADPGTGAHVCLRAKTPEQVDAFHAAALARGGNDDGPPGPRHYSRATVYAAFARDPDGNRLEAATILESRA